MSKKTLLLFFLITFSTLTGGSLIGNVAAVEQSSMVENDFNLQFEHQWDDDEVLTNQTSFDVNSIVGNLTETDFLASGLTAYVGTQVPDTALTKYYYRVRLTHLWVDKDGDSIGAGDICLRGWINQQTDDTFDNTIDWDYSLGSFNNGESAIFNATLYQGWAYRLFWGIELYDDDAGSVDSFGLWTKSNYRPVTSQTWTANYDVNIGIGNNATLEITVDVLSGPQNFTANDLLDAYKPYLIFDVETSHETDADVYGRVIQGFDPVWNKTTTCLQYLFYYPYEYSGTNQFIHYWDWEMMYMYLDVSANGSLLPYRVVWDNGFYFSTSQDWIDGQDYRIFENNATAGSYIKTVTFSEPLWPLLGKSRDMKYKVENLSAIWTSDMEKWGYFEWGIPTLIATVDTSYHQFDMGKANPDTINMYRNYVINDFNTSVIKAAYNSLNSSFSSGVHSIGGEYTPNYAPFSWDISQPFTRPYILNNYPKLVCDVTAFTNANASKKSMISVDKQINLRLDCPAQMNMSLPNYLAPGDPVSTNLNVFLDQSKAKLTIDIVLNVSINIDCLFFKESWNFIINNSIVFDAYTKSLSIFGIKLDMSTTDLSNIEVKEKSWGDFVTTSGTITPKLVGEILSAQISISISEIIKSFIVNPVATNILKLLVDDFSLVINPVISGYMQTDLYWGTTLIADDFKFNETYSSIPVIITTPEGTDSAWNLDVRNLEYGVNFKVNWGLDFAWAKIPSCFWDDKCWDIGTWPNLDFPLEEGTATLTRVAGYQFNSNKDKWILSNGFNEAITIPPDSIPGTTIAAYPQSIFMLLIGGSVIILIRKYKSKIRS